MKTSYFSIATDDSNDQELEKINSATVRIFDVNQYKVVTKFPDMPQFKESIEKDNLGAIDASMSKCGDLWDQFVLLGVDNTSVIHGCYKSVIVESRKKKDNITLT